VYDVAGRLVRILETQMHRAPGTHRVAWDGTDEAGTPAASGVYFYEMTANAHVVRGRMVLLK
jgi:flagellar hook assembly protein FlgD